MTVAEFLTSDHPTGLSIEILPPLRGKSVENTYRSLDQLAALAPAYINITTHRTEVEYRQVDGGAFRIFTAKRRPGTVAIAAAIRERYGIKPVPHIICGEFTRGEIEDQLIDLAYMGLTDVLALRGDRRHDQRTFVANGEGHSHADSLCRQIVDFNAGIMADGSQADPVVPPISFGVAGYPEKHDEAMNPSADLQALRRKVDTGAGYIVTQMFFDNQKYFDFVARCRKAGITVPIVPGLKPLTSLTQKVLLPRTFHIDLPDTLASEFERCADNAAVRALGVEWATTQARELKAAGVPSIHFYTLNATPSVVEIVKNVY